MSPAKKRRAAVGIQDQLKVSERRVCRVLEQPRSTQRRAEVVRTDEESLRELSSGVQIGDHRVLK